MKRNALVRYRASKGLSQSEMALLLSISRQAYQSIENFKVIPRLSLAIQICILINRQDFDWVYHYEN